MQLSVVIPVYNVERYIAKCLSSCINQVGVEKNKFEIIVVNDGTKDYSINVISDLLEKNNNIRLINKENGGLSSARNKGLEYVRGKYVWFVDSDDFIDNDSIRNILSDIESYDSEILFYDINCINEDNGFERLKKMDFHSKPYTQSGGEWLRKGVNVWPMAQMYVFKKAFLCDNNLYFKEGILHEDVEFKFRSFLFANSVTYIPQKHYNYLLRNNGSITASFSNKRMHDLYSIVCDECMLLDSLKDNVLRINASFALMRNFENYINFISSNKVSYKLSDIRKLSKLVKPWLKNCIVKAPIKHKMKLISLYVSPRILYFWFYIRS